MTRDKVYEESNSVLEVDYIRFSKKEYKALLGASENYYDRQMKGQALLDYLCDKYDIPHVMLYVENVPQRCRGNATIHGNYTYPYNRIRIYNQTAKQRKIVSIKVFANTLLHEFMHHYDFFYLKMATSLHTKGFYMRISDLDKKLK